MVNAAIRAALIVYCIVSRMQRLAVLSTLI
nr:MAG TPA: hypothetical protein [Caudoviricetes sp.]